MECLDATPLTLSNLNLSGLQVKDTDRTEAFIRSQRTFATAFAVGGASRYEPLSVVIFSEDKATTEPDQSNAIQGGGFSSPVLRARVEKVPQEVIRTKTALANPKGPRRGTRQVPAQIVPGSNLETGEKSRSTIMTRTSKKRPASLDREHVARLAERRERKRANRAVMKPILMYTESEEKSSSSSSHDVEKRKKSKPKKKTGKKKHPKTDSALTLMQNFLATNVGKERLTLKPGPNMGFFNKGKASAPIKTDCRREKRKKDFTFSESKFLNNLGPPSPQFEAETDSSISRCSTPRPEIPSPNLSKFFVTGSSLESTKLKRGKRQVKDVETPEVHSRKKTVVKRKIDSSYGPRESDVWDIELDKPLPSEEESERDPESDAPVVLSTTWCAWELSNQQSPPAAERLETSLIESGDRHSVSSVVSGERLQSDILSRDTRSPSLAPSNSASQQDVATIPLPNNASQLPDSAQDGQSPKLSGCDLFFSPPREHPSFRFRPNHKLKKYEPPMSPAPESLLFPPCFEYELQECSSQRICQGDQEIISPRAEDDSLQPMMFSETQVNDEILRGVVHSLPGCNYYEGSPEDSGYWDGFYWQNAAMDEGIYFDHHSDQRASADCFDDDDISEYQLCEWGEDMSVRALADHGVMDEDRDEDLCEAELDDTSRLPLLSPPADCEPRFLFTQGRSLLLGVEGLVPQNSTHAEGGLEHVEVEVARRLKDHWVPQKL